MSPLFVAPLAPHVTSVKRWVLCGRIAAVWLCTWRGGGLAEWGTYVRHSERPGTERQRAKGWLKVKVTLSSRMFFISYSTTVTMFELLYHCHLGWHNYRYSTVSTTPWKPLFRGDLEQLFHALFIQWGLKNHHLFLRICSLHWIAKKLINFTV